MGKHGEAEQLYRKVLVVRERIFGLKNLDTAFTLNDLAGTLGEMGRHTEAEKLYRLSLEVRQDLLGIEHPEVARVINNLAVTLGALGNYNESERLHRQALAQRQKLLGNTHRHVAISANNLALVLGQQKEYYEAESMLRLALSIWKMHLGHEHPDVATGLHNLAVVLSEQKRYNEAELIHREALKIRTKILGESHPNIAVSLDNIAIMFDKKLDYNEAEHLHRMALSIRQKVFGPIHQAVATSKHNLATVLLKQGKLDTAESLYTDALSIRKRTLGENHPLVAETLSSLARLNAIFHKDAVALLFAEEAARIEESTLRQANSQNRMTILSKSMHSREEQLSGLFFFRNAYEATRKFVETTVLLRKGRAQDVDTLFNRLINKTQHTPVARQGIDKWRSVREQREALLYKGLGNRKPEEYQEELKKLQIQADSLEAQLAQSLPEIRTLQPPSFDDIIPEVAKRIPASGVLIEVVWTRPYQPKAKYLAPQWGAPHFVALLLYPDQHIVSVDLGLAAEIDQTGTELRQELRNPRGNPLPAAQAMYRKVFAPLLPHLAGRTEVYLSLDGSLHMIPFDALHDGKDYLLGQYRFHYLTSGRDLLRQPSQQPPGAPLILANPNFGTVDSAGPEQKMTLYQKLSGLAPLPAAQSEASYIASLAGTRPLLGDAAQEEVIQKAHSPWFVHIATHGMFLRDVEPPVSSDARSGLLPLAPTVPPAMADGSAAEKLPGEAGAMNRAALVLAQVRQGHRATSTDKDGLLTAQEARSLDLDGTQLVTLSACDTGEGSLSAGQGVYGLRRAFLVAGAETLVTSLWSVDDQATGELMKRYYAKLLGPRNPGDRLGAMVDSMKELRQMLGRSHPYYWAPFLVIGQDGPLRKPAAVNRQGTTK